VLVSNFASTSNRNALGLTEQTRIPELDALLNEISTLPTTEERYAKAAEVQEYLVDHALTIPLYELPQTYAASAAVRGLTWEPVGRVVLTRVWIEQ